MSGLLAALKRGNGVMRTRFPPEPNGALHLGHVRALHINFATAQYYSGKCGLRFDDSNPETAKRRYYDDINEVIAWLGYSPYTVTRTSQYFSELYEYALRLVACGTAYVCH